MPELMSSLMLMQVEHTGRDLLMDVLCHKSHGVGTSSIRHTEAHGPIAHNRREMNPIPAL